MANVRYEFNKNELKVFCENKMILVVKSIISGDENYSRVLDLKTNFIHVSILRWRVVVGDASGYQRFTLIRTTPLCLSKGFICGNITVDDNNERTLDYYYECH